MTFLSLWNWLKPLRRQAAVCRRRHRRHDRTLRARILPRLETLEDRTVPSTLTVTNSLDTGVAGDGSLRGEIAAATSGDRIVFDPSLQGQTITLTSGELAMNKSLDIEGLGAGKLTVSGNHASRVFDLTGSGANVTIAGLTIADGLATQGGGIENVASNLTLSKDILSHDQAVGLPGGSGKGGAIFNGSAATLRIIDSVFTGDVVKGGAAAGANGDAGAAFGGGLYNAGVATVTESTLTANQARGGDGGPHGVGGNGIGAGIFNVGSLTVRDSVFDSNLSIGGAHGRMTDFPFIGAGAGAGIYSQATLTVTASVFTHNHVQGGAGYAGVPGGGGNGAAILAGADDDQPPEYATLRDCTFIDNEALGGAGGAHAAGGQGSGGAVLVDHGNFILRDCTFLGNQAVGGTGGTGGTGGPARGGALRNAMRDGSDIVTVSDCVFRDNEAVGGAAGSGGVGGLASGGAVSNAQLFANDFTGALTLRDCVLRDNEAVGGAGATGGAARGGGISNEGGPTLVPGGISTTIIDCLISRNEAQGGTGSAGNGGNGQGGGVFTDAHSTLTLIGSRITRNEADGGTGDGGGSDGQGVGGGVYVATGGKACKDAKTRITKNEASTSNDDVFGVLGTC